MEKSTRELLKDKGESDPAKTSDIMQKRREAALKAAGYNIEAA
jgi:hypothetical protein